MLEEQFGDRGNGVLVVARRDAVEGSRDSGGVAASSGDGRDLGTGGVAGPGDVSGGGVAAGDDLDEGSETGGLPAGVTGGGSTPRAVGSFDANKAHMFASTFYQKLAESPGMSLNVSQFLGGCMTAVLL